MRTERIVHDNTVRLDALRVKLTIVANEGRDLNDRRGEIKEYLIRCRYRRCLCLTCVRRVHSANRGVQLGLFG